MMAIKSRAVSLRPSVAPNPLPTERGATSLPSWRTPLGYCCGIACLLAVLLTGPLGPSASASTVVQFDDITIDTGTIPGYIPGVTAVPLVATLRVTQSGSSFNTEGFTTQFSWSSSGLLWSGSTLTNEYLTTSGTTAVFNKVAEPGFLFQPVAPTGALVTPSAPLNTNTRTFDINSNIAGPNTPAFSVPLVSSTMATIGFTINPDVRSGQFVFTFLSNTTQFGFTEADSGDFDIIPFTNGGGLITVVPEPATAGVLAGMAVAGAGYIALRWRRRRHDRGLLADDNTIHPEGEAARGV